MNDFLIDYPNKLEIIFEKLNENNIKPIIVGGYVRDKLLKIPSKDIDVELYGVENFTQLEAILSEFGSVNNVGKSFGVCKLFLKDLGIEIDFTQPRTDNKTGAGHRGFDIKVDNSLDFKSASSRRDFTINAIGYDTIDKKILDPFGGIDDLKKKIIKAVNLNTFSEDPLRILRVVSFASRLNFSIDPELFSLCQKMVEKKKIEELPKERVYEEIKKILCKSLDISLAFSLFKKLNLLNFFHPLDTLSKTQFEALLVSLKNITNVITCYKKQNIEIMLAVICSQFNREQTELFLSNLTDDKKILKNVTSLVGTKFNESYSDAEIYQLAATTDVERFLLFHKCVNNDIFIDEIKKRAVELNVLNNKLQPIVNGEDLIKLGLNPSERFSKILQDTYEAQMQFKFKDKQEALKWLEKYLLA